MDPYSVLEISEDANDQQVRDAYLELVRRYPPDGDAEKFQQVRQAYEMVRDEASRVRLRLFGTGRIDRFSSMTPRSGGPLQRAALGHWLAVLEGSNR